MFRLAWLQGALVIMWFTSRIKDPWSLIVNLVLKEFLGWLIIGGWCQLMLVVCTFCCKVNLPFSPTRPSVPPRLLIVNSWASWKFGLRCRWLDTSLGGVVWLVVMIGYNFRCCVIGDPLQSEPCVIGCDCTWDLDRTKNCLIEKSAGCWCWTFMWFQTTWI